MKNTYTNKLAVAIMVASLGFLSLSAMAGQDFFQQQMTQRVMKAKQQAKVAEAAKQQAAAIKAEECKTQIEQGKNATGN
ncbi:MAG: hypothetical protein HOP21_08980 [Methylotenera sp.]|jgi:hypothetical protein|nr:hypothetical protein [Methylotenera sp.]